MNDFDSVNKNHGLAVVSGASRGIGFATAKSLGNRGLTIAAISHDRSRLDDAVGQLREQGINAFAYACNVQDEEAVAKTTAQIVAEHGAPRVVIANAGIVRRGLVHDLRVEDFDAVMNTNLRGVFLLAHGLIGSMRNAKRGRFIAVSSISATLGTAGASAYNASKWAVNGFIKSLAEELRDTGVQAMSINPGSVDTDMLKGSPWQPQMSADDCAKLLTFLALDAPAAMNASAVDMFGP